MKISKSQIEAQRSGFDLERWRSEMSELCHRWQSEGYGAFFTAAALADGGTPDPDKLQKALEQTAAQFESAALEVRRLCERYSTGTGGYGSRPVLPPMEIAGSVELLGYNWLHITLNTLLPHCRFQPPEWLSDTIRRLLTNTRPRAASCPFSTGR